MHIFILSSCPPPCTFQTFIPCCIIIFILDSFRTFFQRLFFKTKSSYTKTIFANTLINIFVISTINVSKLRSAQTRIDEAEGGKKRIKKTVSTASNYLSFLYLKSVRIRTTTLFLVSLSRDTTRVGGGGQPGGVSVTRSPTPASRNESIRRWKEAFSKRYISRSIVVCPRKT